MKVKTDKQLQRIYWSAQVNMPKDVIDYICRKYKGKPATFNEACFRLSYRLREAAQAFRKCFEK